MLLITACSDNPEPPAQDTRPIYLRFELEDSVRTRALDILREGLSGDDFWPSMHAAEGLTLAGYENEVLENLPSRLENETDDQRRCGLARELVRAGDTSYVSILIDVQTSKDPHGHVHAAESLYKIGRIGDPAAMEAAFRNPENTPLQLMAAGALARSGREDALAFIRESVRSDDLEKLRIAAWLLGRIGNEGDIELLIEQFPKANTSVLAAYLNHSIAALGGVHGSEELALNLTSDNPEIRTYAATFAGDAMAFGSDVELILMLDDPHPDARYRAAQTLLLLDRKARENREKQNKPK